MKRFLSLTLLSFILIMLLNTGCHSDPERSNEHERPGQEETTHMVAFSAGNPGEILVGENDEEIYLILYRESARGAEERTYDVACRGDGSGIKPESKVTFGAGAQETKLRVSIFPSRLKDNSRTEVEICLVGTEASHRLIVVKPAKSHWQYETAKGFFICPDGCHEVEIEIGIDKDKRWYTATSEGFERHFMVDNDNNVVLLPYGGVVDASTMADMRIEPSFGVSSLYNKEEGFFAFNAAEPDIAPNQAPHREYLWTGSQPVLTEAIYTDGWLVEHVMTAWGGPWGAKDTPWKVLVQEKESSQGRQLRILDPYCGGCPLSIANAAPAGSSICILVRGDGTATIEEQDIPFVNNDVWNFNFRIAAYDGRVDGNKIVFERPLHNCLGDKASPSVDQTWKTITPTIVELNQSSISDI